MKTDLKLDELIEFLKRITELPGSSGFESPVAHALAEAFRPLCHAVRIDSAGNVLACQEGSGPCVMLVAHMDEIGLVTTSVGDDGSIRFLPVGMADQILPAHEVRLLTDAGPLYGVVGYPDTPRGKFIPADKLFIDTGLPVDEVRRLVPAGTPVQLLGETIRLQNDRVAGKTLDDRACAAILFAVAKEMKRRAHDARIFYVLSTQEEVTGLGALVAAYGAQPDFAIVLDVTHAAMDDCKPGAVFSIDASTLAAGPNLHPRLTDRIREQAERLGVKIETEVIGGATGTDAWEVQTAREGIPCALVSLPVKSMHTSVELCSARTMLLQAHMLAQTLAELEPGWEETLCY